MATKCGLVWDEKRQISGRLKRASVVAEAEAKLGGDSVEVPVTAITTASRLSGAQAALPIWTDFMIKALSGRPNVPFTVPDGITFVDIDRDNDVDQSDFGIVQRCISGENGPVYANCAN